MSERKRLHRNQRSDAPPNMRLTERDVEILKAVAEYRIMRQDQIQRLFFGSQSTAQYRLSHLYQHGFLARHFLPVYAGWSPTLYSLDKRGLTVLRSDHESKRVNLWNSENGHEFLSHTLALHDFRIALTIACREAHYQLSLWLGEADLKADYDRVIITDAAGKKQSVSLIPDGYFTIETPRGKTSCFLEMDMGSMTLGRFQNKIRAYTAYMKSGRYQERYQTKSLRILTVTNSQTRCRNLKMAAEGLQAERVFLFTDKAQMSVQTILHIPIWHVPGSMNLSVLVPT